MSEDSLIVHSLECDADSGRVLKQTLTSCAGKAASNSMEGSALPQAFAVMPEGENYGF
jgi:hypothetical protein